MTKAKIPYDLKDCTKRQRKIVMDKRLKDAILHDINFDSLDNQEISLAERCYLVRTLKGVTLKAAALDMGISHVSLIKRERGAGDVRELAEYWGLA
jgi:hypothetical protein